MRLKYIFPIGILLAMWLTDCATINSAVFAADSTVLNPTPGTAIDAGENTSIIQYEEPTGVLKLQVALQAALAKHPSLAAAVHEIEARKGAAKQAGLFSNPKLFGEIDEFGGSGEFSGTDIMEMSVGISQEIPLAGKLSKQVKAANYATSLAEWELKLRILELKAEVQKKFLQVHALEKALAMEQENLRLVQDASTAVSKRVKAGDIPPLDETKAAVEFAYAKVSLARTERNLETARRELAATWGSSSPRFESVEWNEPEMPDIPNENLFIEALKNHPQTKIVHAKIARNRAILTLTKAEAWPNVEVEGGIKQFNESDEHAFFLGVNIPIPLFDRNQGSIQEAHGNLNKSQQELKSSDLEMNTQLKVLLNKLKAARAELTATSEVILPGAEQAYHALNRAYQIGELDYLELLDGQRTLLVARRTHLALVTESRQLLTELETLAGTSVSSLSKKSNDIPEVKQ